MARQILKFYIDDPVYIKPKEVCKAFHLFGSFSKATGSNKAAIKEELLLLMKVIMMSFPDGCSYELNALVRDRKEFFYLEIYKVPREELFTNEERLLES